MSTAIDFNELVADVREAAAAEVKARREHIEAEDELERLKARVGELATAVRHAFERHGKVKERLDYAIQHGKLPPGEAAPSPPAAPAPAPAATARRAPTPAAPPASSKVSPAPAPPVAPAAGGVGLLEERMKAAKFRRHGGTQKGIPEQMAELFGAHPERTYSRPELAGRFGATVEVISDKLPRLQKLLLAERRGRGRYGAFTGGAATSDADDTEDD